ncbi:MAG: hypothetical protein ACI837_001308 [Crocinitomicaceae bacterium]|jgi:hypothetical protein
MRTNLRLKLITSTISLMLMTIGFAQEKMPACSPSSTNTLCSAATPLTVGASCINGTTCDGGAQSASSCLYGGSECSWYSFVATGTDMFVDISVTATDGCHISSNVYAATGGGGCIGAEISCQSGAPLDDLHALTGLTIGNTYYVQVCYSPGGPCGNGGQADYCITVGVPAPPCDVCATPCGTAGGYATNPAVATVVADCQTSPFVPELAAGSTHTFCYSFTATATSVDFNVIITSNCGGGNVTGLTWNLYNSPSCGAAVQSGTLASLTFTPVVIGNDYVFCYTFTVPGTCTHTQHCPFFVGATTPLSVSLNEFDAKVNNTNEVELDWNTSAETDNDFFTIERSANGVDFVGIENIKGAGTSTMVNTYSTVDREPITGLSYYRLKQTDFDGKFTRSDIVAVDIARPTDLLELHPNPVSGKGQLLFNSEVSGIVAINVLDLFGRVVITKTISAEKGVNSSLLDLSELKGGMYILSLNNGDNVSTLRFIKK